ncbi:MAG TPA: hypothetical protein VHH36_04555 [Candidatus Thermoplasmatota archaeon]|nr:hypothetical protein [Candidatus Thermoplasmatota archaeon]
MALDAGADVAVAAGLGAALLLASAKAHGRQIRLEREREGHVEVQFGGDNHPWVEALWRRDRVRYWTAAPLLALAALLALPSWPARLVGALLWAPSGAFALAGLWSLARLERRGGEAGFLRRARRGSLLWWGLAMALAAASAFVALRP